MTDPLPYLPDAIRNLTRVHPIDLLYGIDTSGYVKKDQIAPTESMVDKISSYAGIQPSVLRKVLQAFPSLDEYNFIDIGCGKGRATVVASEFPFKKIFGIDISPALTAVAEKNAAIIREKFPSRPAIEITTGDATQIPMAEGKVVLFLYNPFGAELTKQLLMSIEKKLQGDLRHVFIIHHNPVPGFVFDASPHLTRWYAKHHSVDPSEVGFGYSTEGVTIIWQSVRNAIPPHHVEANRQYFLPDVLSTEFIA